VTASPLGEAKESARFFPYRLAAKRQSISPTPLFESLGEARIRLAERKISQKNLQNFPVETFYFSEFLCYNYTEVKRALREKIKNYLPEITHSITYSKEKRQRIKIFIDKENCYDKCFD
jgi:hypothetical protein